MSNVNVNDSDLIQADEEEEEVVGNNSYVADGGADEYEHAPPHHEKYAAHDDGEEEDEHDGEYQEDQYHHHDNNEYHQNHDNNEYHHEDYHHDNNDENHHDYYNSEHEYRYSTGESGNEYFRYRGSQGESGEYRSSYDTGDWYDYEDWQHDDADEDLEVASGELEGGDETLNHESPEESLEGEESEGKGSSNEKSSGSKKKKKVAPPVELGKRSFRWFERKLLAQQIPASEENLRRKRLLEKCQLLRKVSAPVVTIFGNNDKLVRSTDSGKVAAAAKKTSKQSVLDGDGGMGEGDVKGEEEEETLSEPSRTFRDFADHEWAMKNTIDFLTTQGCSSSSSRSYKSSLRAAREEADFRLALYERQLQKRRNAIGNSQGAPEITAALRRHAERAVWRAVIDNTKPRYPLPRFILPRHKYLKKVQAQFIGPGSYEVDVYEKQTKSRQMRLPSTWATCTSRFPKDDNEGDGKSGKGGRDSDPPLLDPWIALDKANLKHKYPGTYIPFESTPKNFRKVMTEGGGSRVPPNAYNIKSPLEEFIKKRTSIRGPYDCYTPPRGVIPYGYHKSQNDDEQGRLGPGSYEIRTSLLKEMHDPYNFFKGTFGKAERNKMFGFKAAFDNPLWPNEDDTKPAVGQYDPDMDFIGADHEQEMAPFKVQSGLKKRDVKKPDLTAPDYYFFGPGATWTVPPKGANLASVFRSKTPQIMPGKHFATTKQRNKASNRKLDLEGLDQGYHLEEHYAYDKPVKNVYVLEDCKQPCPGGPRVDMFAIPGYGIGPNGVSINAASRSKGGCCGC